MITTFRAVFFIASATSLSACGGSSTSPVVTPIDTISDDPTACATAFHNGIRGSYNGQVEFQSPEWVSEPESCTWEVSLSVATDADSIGLCTVSFDFESELISGTDSCNDLATSGDISGTYGIDEQAPQWPVELSLSTPQTMSTASIYATGNERDNGRWSYIFDGNGNASLPEVSEAIGYIGILVLFSDQPNQMDKSLNIGFNGMLFD